MTDRKKVLTLRIINAVFFIILILFQYNTVFEIKIRNATPLLPLALIIGVAVNDTPFVSVSVYSHYIISSPVLFAVT